MPREPSPEHLRNPLLIHVLAVRPPFLLVSVVACWIGLAHAVADGIGLDVFGATLTILGAMLVHAGVNVLNDYYDALNGTDARNTQRVYPFSGGSRFIQNGLLTPRHTAVYGFILLVLGGLCGAVLALRGAWGLWPLGVLGLVLGWAYSAPPLDLNRRGLGELSVAAGFGLLIPLGADYVQRLEFAWTLVLIALPYGLLVMNILYIAQFPDREADAAVGKCHWVVRWGARRARWAYLAASSAAYGLVVLWVMGGLLPVAALWSLAALPLSLLASIGLVRHAEDSARLGPAIGLTILAALVHGVVLSLVWVA